MKRLNMEEGPVISIGESSERVHERLLKSSVQAYNTSSGNLKGYDCPKCRNRGDFEEIRDGEVVRVPCGCGRIRRNLRMIEASGLAGAIAEKTFASFQTPEGWQQERKAKAMQYLNDDSGRWFAIFGGTGSGKTHLCTAICGELLRRGHLIRYIEWTRFAQSLDRLHYKPEELADYYEPVRETPVLYIDDLFKHEHRGRALSYAFDLLDHRNNAGLRTILSGELELAEIAALDTALAGRIVEACGEYLFQNGKDAKRNWRLRRG